jgi:RES domain-containing protein
VPLRDLGPLFRDVVRIYAPSDGWGGDAIGYLLQEDFNVFSDLIEADPDVRDRMAVSILESGLSKDDVDEPDYAGGFNSSPSAIEDDWETEIELIFQSVDQDPGRFPQTLYGPGAEFRRLDAALENLATNLPIGTEFYRARRHEPRSRKAWFDPDEMGAPPPANAESQRANRKGEPVLYMASDIETAVAETRGWRGAVVAIATMQTIRELGVVDLTADLKVSSPFFRDNLDWELNLNAAVYRIGKDLSRPVLRGEKDTLYKATQHFCDIVRRVGLDGLVYPSALGPGRNVVLFDPTAAVARSVEYLRIRGVAFTSENLRDQEDPYEDLPAGYPDSAEL